MSTIRYNLLYIFCLLFSEKKRKFKKEKSVLMFFNYKIDNNIYYSEIFSSWWFIFLRHVNHAIYPKFSISFKISWIWITIFTCAMHYEIYIQNSDMICRQRWSSFMNIYDICFIFIEQMSYIISEMRFMKSYYLQREHMIVFSKTHILLKSEYAHYYIG